MGSPGNELTTILEPANPKHQRVAILLSYGLLPEEIADRVKLAPGTIEQVAKKPGTRRKIKHLQVMAARMGEIRDKEFDQLLDMSLGALFDVLGDENANHDQKMRAAFAIMDRHPEGRYIKNSKTTTADETGMVSEAIQALKVVAQKNNREMAEAIDITPKSTPETANV